MNDSILITTEQITPFTQLFFVYSFSAVYFGFIGYQVTICLFRMIRRVFQLDARAELRARKLRQQYRLYRAKQQGQSK